MKRLLLALAITSLAVAGFAQETKPTISINAKGEDVRSVIHDLFKQANKNFVLNPGVRFVLYLSLDKVAFEDALAIVCKNANLKFEIQKDIYHISPVPAKPVVEQKPPVIEKQPIIEDKMPPLDGIKTEPKVTKPAVKHDPPKAKEPKGTLPTTVLNKRVTTRLQKREIKEVLNALSQQTGVTIEISEDVPAYKLDAFLINTSLKFALDEITRATKLKYRFTDKLSISVEK